MSLIEQIDIDIIKALKAGEKDRLIVLRGLKSDLKYKQIASGDKITDALATEVLSTAAKRRRDSIEQFRKGDREDLALKEESELEIIATYLPKQLTENELRVIVTAAISETGAESPKQMGQIMKVLMPKTKGRADGKLVNKLIIEILAN
jgi:hypothetical protein